MSKKGERPDVSAVLSRLKGFQRRTAQYAFRRLFLDEDSTRRFLVADEVGLGKTKVAQGVIALALDHLWEKVDRIDIVYICSNGDIARQNMARLNVPVPDQKPFQMASRITMLPTVVKDLNQQAVNLVALTPGTSFDLKSSMGTAEERVLLYWMLDPAWGLQGRVAPYNLLQGWVADKDDFRNRVATFDRSSIDASLRESFARDLEAHIAKDQAAGRPDLRTRFEELCERFGRYRQNPPQEDQNARARLIGELRAALAASCLRALQPDLIILDEFQRFKHLLSEESEAALLARELFNYSDETTKARVLLLSATPYKMYTLQSESAEDDHYQDFLDTLRFLDGDGADLTGMQHLLRDYRRELYRLADDSEAATARLTDLKGQLEQHLRRVMVRTERLAASEDRSGMLIQVPADTARLAPNDLHGYLTARKVAEVVGEPDPLTYWKASPYLLNLMDEYKLKRKLERELDLPGQRETIARALDSFPAGLLPFEDVRAYRAIDPANARLRSLQAETVDAGMWQMLWMPPSLPYYQMAGPYGSRGVGQMTKRLIFSAWQVVPKAAAALLSYEAERRMIALFEGEGKAENTPEARRRRRPLLRFARTGERLTGMPVLGLLYPSAVLAEAGDPLAVGLGLSLPELLARARERLAEGVGRLVAEAPQEGPADEAWYWAAPILLDRQVCPEVSQQWFGDGALAAVWSGASYVTEDDGDESHWAAHVDLARSLVQGTAEPLGRPPEDLLDVLALLAVAGPGVAALRALRRVVPEPGEEYLAIRDYAGQMAWALRSLFNLPEATALVRGLNREEPYWRRVLEYCADGCLSAVLDEYAHVLLDAKGLRGKFVQDVLQELSAAMVEAVTLRTVTLFADEIRVGGNSVSLAKEGMRARFALRYGAETGEDGKQMRHTQVQGAFNSPFWPFVLASTSVGQEGLDFHPYCHAVVHWDLPSNPVDMEQREGRVHRYKGHAIRKNVAAAHGAAVGSAPDPWEAMFGAAAAAGGSDLVPFWVFPGPAKIERHVPCLPLSRDLERLGALRRSLAMYRMVFGQSRQEDLVEYLLEQVPRETVESVVGGLRVELGPPDA